MTYAVKEMFLTLQGEGVQVGRRAVFLRFAGCNLWTGREDDRAKAVCTFCDTDFVGTDGDGGGKFTTAEDLAKTAFRHWGDAGGTPYIVITGGEPLLQLDTSLIDALHAQGFEIGVESNGTLEAPDGIDWLCISPKSDSVIVQRKGNELKLVWPQPRADWQAMQDWEFDHFLIQPMDCADAATARAEAMQFVMDHPNWRLSLQTHKILSIR